MPKKGFCVILLFLASFTLGAQVKWAFTSYEPANYINKNSEPTGFFVDIMQELFRRVGKTLIIEHHPWLRCQALAQAGLVDIITTIPTKERLDYSIPVNPPIWEPMFCVYALKSHPGIKLMDRIQKPEDIAALGYSVLTYSGNDFLKTTLLSKGVKLIESGSVESMYKMLVAGRGDCIVEIDLLASRNLKAFGFTQEVQKTNGTVEGAAYNILISKKSAYKELAPLLSDTLKAMYEDGTIKKIMAGYN